MKRLAAALPVKPEIKGHVKKSVYGGELIGQGLTKLKTGEEVVPKKEYTQTIPIKGRVDHVEKMKAAYKKGGIDAVKEYINRAQ